MDSEQRLYTTTVGLATDMSADIFTKSLAGNLFFYHADAINGKRKRSSEEAIERGRKKPGGASQVTSTWTKKHPK